MSPKPRRGLQSGLSEIIARQTAPAPDKAEESKRLITRFSDLAVPPDGIPSDTIPPRDIPAENTPPPVQAAPREGVPPPSIPPDGIPTPGIARLVNPDRGYYPTFNDVSDTLIPELKLDAYEQAVLWRLYRLSRGWWRDTCVVGHTKLAKATNLSRSTVQKTVARLTAHGLIESLGDRGNDGTEYRVLPGVAVPQRGIPRDGIPSDARGVPSGTTRRSDGIPSGGHNKNKEQLKNINKPLVCDLCEQSPGFIYPSGIVGQGPVKKCRHGKGK